MKLTSTDTLAGVPVLRLRDALRFRTWTSPELLSARLKSSQAAASAILAVLLQQGLVAPADQDGRHEFTVAGNAFRLAHALKPISRAKADQFVQDFLLRVEEINTSTRFLVRVARVRAFGSYITPAPSVHDIDLVVDLEDKLPPEGRATRSLEHAAASGRTFSNFVERLFWPHREVQLFLKSRSTRLSLHPPDDGIVKRVRTRQLYPPTRTP